MSDRPSDLEFKFKHIVIAVRDVAEWFDLGLQLGVPEATLRLIAADPSIKDINSQRRAMLSEWTRRDTAASWEKLAAALTMIGEKVAAANVRSGQFMKTTSPSTEAPDISEDEKTCQEMKQNVLQTIKCQFASLQLEIRLAMEARQVKVSDVHQFLVASFDGDCSIPEDSDLTKIFNIVMKSKLWRYDNYIPLKKLAEKFLPSDDPARKLITEYRSQLSGFYTTTKIVEFIDLSKLEEETEDDTEQPAFIAENYKKHYRTLTVKLKLDRKVKLSNLTLNYVNTLWKALVDEFNLPPLTAIIKKIVGGSLIIEWLVSLQVSTVIAASYSKALRFYQQHNIVEVELDDDLLYHEYWFVDSTPLYQASFMGNVDEIKKYLEGGADLNVPNDHRFGETALFGACQSGHAETARVLLDYGADVNYKNSNGESALCCASSYGDTECVKVLLKYGAQVDLPDNNGDTALIEASRYGWVEIAEILLDYRANIDNQNHRGETALKVTSHNGESEIVSLLLKAGAKTDIQEETGATALYWAAYGDCINIVKMLVAHGAGVDITNKRGKTGLMEASLRGYTDTVRVLLEAKADPNITDENNQTALYRATTENRVEVVKMLIAHGAAVDIRDKLGNTDLMRASGKGYIDTVRALLEAKANPNITDENGQTALFRATTEDRVEVVKLLVQFGAEVGIRNKEGLTALDLARAGGYQAVCEVLEQYTKQETSTELTQEQRESIYQRLLKMLERTFLKEQAKKKEYQQQKEHHQQREEREKRSLWSRLRGRRNRQRQIIGIAPAPEK